MVCYGVEVKFEDNLPEAPDLTKEDSSVTGEFNIDSSCSHHTISYRSLYKHDMNSVLTDGAKRMNKMNALNNNKKNIFCNISARLEASQ